MVRLPIIAANWKLHKTTTEASAFATALRQHVPESTRVEVIIAAPFTALATLHKVLQDTPVHVSAQNLFWESQGAYTGEISAPMLLDVGCTYVIIGHSERRQLFGETDGAVRQKVAAALQAGLNPIVCVGESLAQREADGTFSVIEQQIRDGLADCGTRDALRVVVAYEPIWAIGTGVTATPEQAQKVHQYIRSLLADLWDQACADAIRIPYGGSVNPTIINSLMAEPDIDGALVGGASLDIESFVQILSYGSSVT